MEEELRTSLLGASGLSALVGTRVDWAVLPQAAATPAVALNLVSEPPTYTMAGRDRLTGSLVQLDCWGVTFKAARDTAKAVVAVLDGLSGPLIRAAFIENRRAAVDAGADGSATFYRTSLDVRVWWIDA